jgi:hypothetical protein
MPTGSKAILGSTQGRTQVYLESYTAHEPRLSWVLHMTGPRAIWVLHPAPVHQGLNAILDPLSSVLHLVRTQGYLDLAHSRTQGYLRPH